MKIRLFTTPNCPFSIKTREFLKANSIEFEDNNVLENPNAMKEMVEISGQMAVPVMEITEEGKDKIIIQGYKEKEFKKALNLEGKK